MFIWSRYLSVPAEYGLVFKAMQDGVLCRESSVLPVFTHKLLPVCWPSEKDGCADLDDLQSTAAMDHLASGALWYGHVFRRGGGKGGRVGHG